MNYTEMLFNRDERLINLLNQADNKNLELIVKLSIKEDEIERLNYIINEFEQWIKDSKRETLMGLGTINRIFFADELLNKLKELKGENNG